MAKTKGINPFSPSAAFENQHMSNVAYSPQRDSELNQQIAKSVRPQLPRDGSRDMARWQPGTLPKGGFRSVFDFSDTPTYNTKKSPTSGGGGKVY
jgi:hypothetical protein